MRYLFSDFLDYIRVKFACSLERDEIIDSLEVCREMHNIKFTNTHLILEDFDITLRTFDALKGTKIAIVKLKDIVYIADNQTNITIFLRSGYRHTLSKRNNIRDHSLYLWTSLNLPTQ